VLLQVQMGGRFPSPRGVRAKAHEDMIHSDLTVCFYRNKSVVASLLLFPFLLLGQKILVIEFQRAHPNRS
jgi:hypothetical protein